jgi:hypothetical protein
MPFCRFPFRSTRKCPDSHRHADMADVRRPAAMSTARGLVAAEGRRLARVSMALLLTWAVAGTFGCASNEAVNGNSASDRIDLADRPVRAHDRQRAIDEMERQYVIGPMTARDFGYRIDWQYPDAGRDIKILKVREDSVFALDDRNFLTRIDRASGARLWRLPIAEPILEIFGLTYVEPLERVYATSGGAVLELDSVSGSQVGRQTLEKIANTAPATYGPYLVYGGRNGQLIWHSYSVGYQWRAYQVSQSIRIKPAVEDHVGVAIGVDGTVMALHLREARMLWSHRLLGRVQATPAIGDGGVFIAGTDQHLWAYDLYSGRLMWRYLSESSLTQPPFFADDHVYQYIADMGLVCFEAFPLDHPGGRIIWNNEDVRGNVVAKRGSRLFVWDQPSRTLTLVDARRGGKIQTINLPQIHRLVMTNTAADEIYASSEDGRVVRLLPR